MCCDSFQNGPHAGQCPDCDADVDSDGCATYGCCYSPVHCDTCGDAPCDLSC